MEGDRTLDIYCSQDDMEVGMGAGGRETGAMEVGMGAGGRETGKHGSRDGGRWVGDRETWK